MAEEVHAHPEGEEAGVRGGAAQAYAPGMAAVAQPVEEGIFLKDRVRWSSIWGGLVVALALQLWLTAIGLAILAPGAAATIAQGISGLGLWAAIAGLIALFIGGFLASRLAGIAGMVNGIWNGVVLWGLAFSILLLFGSLGAGGLASYLTGPTATVTPGQSPAEVQQTLAAASRGSWWFVLGQFLGLLAAAGGGALGARRLTEEEMAARHEVRR